MKRTSILLTLVIVLIAALLLGCNAADDAEKNAEDATPLPPVIQANDTVSAEAFLVPPKEANLAFEGGGPVVELAVKEGDAVKMGQVLAHLSDADAKAAVASAEAALAQAQASLAQAKAGPTAEQIGMAEAAVTRAQANLAQVVAGAPDATDEQIAVAQARVNTLKAQLAQVKAGTRPETIAASLASVKQAENALKLAQSDYDKIAYAADSDLAQPIALALENATLNYEAALASHQVLLDGATPAEIAVVQAQVAEGEAALAQTKAPAIAVTAEQIAVAQAGVLEAEAALAQAKAGPTAEQIAVAEAGVQQAEAALQQTRLALDKLALSAPFDGEAVSVNIEVGEIAAPGVPVVNLADLSTWQLETDDLTELDVVKVTAGQSVDVKFDALPGETFKATVKQIKPRSQTKAGDVTYTVVIELDDASDSRLRWGMTAFVEIETE
ncbi:MAG TPA: HlyD family efflux transporter periplasmic adaptor subunit [Chloroflexi bacterium]|nr:HlyD family efflux transporter periplasmic adaptor subunit [Chloroflexota bacterium]